MLPCDGQDCQQGKREVAARGHIHLSEEGIGGAQPLLEGDETVELELPRLDIDLLNAERPVRQGPSGVHVGRPGWNMQLNGLATRVA